MEPVIGDVERQTRSLEDVASAACYHDWLVSLARPYIGDDALEVGSGFGDYAARWASTRCHVTATEAEPTRLEFLRRRFADCAAVTVRELVVPSHESGRFSSVLAFNVLEHIADDVAALRGFAELLRPGGAVVLFVPAFPAAMSRFDVRVGHQRRYRLDTLLTCLAAAGLRTERLHYVNAPGLLAWFVGMRLLGMSPTDGPVLRVWDRLVVPRARALERRRPPPFGQSIFSVARV